MEKEALGLDCRSRAIVLNDGAVGVEVASAILANGHALALVAQLDDGA